jgi:hypothetical protein
LRVEIKDVREDLGAVGIAFGDQGIIDFAEFIVGGVADVKDRRVVIGSRKFGFDVIARGE